MTIDWSAFTPVASLVGGLMIGVAAMALMALNGRIMGVSGIAGGLVSDPKSDQTQWRLSFVIGLIAGPMLYQLAAGQIQVNMVVSAGPLALAGLMVGLGTSIGAGCTSGHGICGISRFSVRSLTATAMFVATGMLATAVFGELSL